jgi:DNA helicase-2/ATP-dependent DNA helicase PcrA
MPTKKKPIPKQIILNEEQQTVTNARAGLYACYAGPGSGKTSVAVRRMAAMIQEGVDPNSILALSFTATAARNLRDRVEALTGPLSITRTAGSMTLHSLALKFAEEERNEFPFELADFPLATEPVAYKLSAEASKRYEIDPRSLRSAISLFKRNRVRPNQAVHDAEEKSDPKQIRLAMAYKAYDKKCREEKVLDFDSLMFEMVDLMSKKKEVRSRWQYQFVTCDEAQDCCRTDWELLKLLSEKYGNLLVVGDPGQSVFGFRGASPKLFLNMEEMFPGTRKLFLATNYRSTKELVGFLKEIGPVPELSEKFTTPNDQGIRPEIRGFTGPVDEAKWVVSKIKEELCTLGWKKWV